MFCCPFAFEAHASRQQLERHLVLWSDDTEVATIDGRDFGGIEPLRCGDYRSVDSAERHVVILSDELGDSDWVSCVQWLDRETAAGKITEEADLGLPAEARPD